MGLACSGQRIPRKVLLTGPKGSGKTTLLYYWSLKTLTETIPTDSFNIETVYTDTCGQLLIWDVTDTARRRQFYHGTDAIVYVFPGGDKNRISSVKTDLRNLLIDRDLQNLPLLLLISKGDNSNMTPDMAKELLELSEVTKRPYTFSGITKNDPTTYDVALTKLAELFYV